MGLKIQGQSGFHQAMYSIYAAMPSSTSFLLIPYVALKVSYLYLFMGLNFAQKAAVLGFNFNTSALVCV